jgi:hypothetical protein
MILPPQMTSRFLVLMAANYSAGSGARQSARSGRRLADGYQPSVNREIVGVVPAEPIPNRALKSPLCDDVQYGTGARNRRTFELLLPNHGSALAFIGDETAR